jgi:hypothetical protein
MPVHTHKHTICLSLLQNTHFLSQSLLKTHAHTHTHTFSLSVSSSHVNQFSLTNQKIRKKIQPQNFVSTLASGNTQISSLLTTQEKSHLFILFFSKLSCKNTLCSEAFSILYEEIENRGLVIISTGVEII